jgi:cytochrome c peroxidase
MGAFKTPFLRDVVLTAPYMHDGSLDTLWDVVDHFNKGGEANPFLDSDMQRIGLTETEIDDVVNLMNAFTSDRFAAQGDAEMQRQRTRRAAATRKGR